MKTAKIPKPPYYAVIFTSKRTNIDDDYSEVANRMVALANKQHGFLGYESAREEIGITISYWGNLESIKNWKKNVDHISAQRNGKAKWYKSYKVRICKVEKEYKFDKNN